MKCNILLYIFILFFIILIQTIAQTTDKLASNITGIPFIQNYGPKEYGALSQNWAIVQDQRGIMYFGSGFRDCVGSGYGNIAAFSLAFCEHYGRALSEILNK